MANSAPVLSVSETMAMLMRSTGKYVYYRLGKADREPYRRAMKACIVHVTSGWENIDIIKAKIEGEYDNIDHLYPKTLFNKRTEERRSHRMAITHAIDIVRTLEARFITGQFDPEPRRYKNMGEFYEDENLFG